MPINMKSSRYQRRLLERMSILQKNKFGSFRNWKTHTPISDIVEKYLDKANLDDESKLQFFKKIDDMMVKNFTGWAVPLLNNRIKTVDDMPPYIYVQEFEDVRDRLWSLLDDVWIPTYRGPVINLGSMSKDAQSIHVKEVETITKGGIIELANMNIPEGQKTLREIEEAFAFKKKSLVSKVIADMKDWGKREAVIKKHENVYRMTLRGLWAKIKTYDPDTQKELIQRLWEEAYESLEMCADGHVGRLVNVFVGFDDAFKSQISPMEYFQNNIAKISENTLSPHDFKIEQAKRLMDDIRMPEADRGAWLEAL